MSHVGEPSISESVTDSSLPHQPPLLLFPLLLTIMGNAKERNKVYEAFPTKTTQTPSTCLGDGHCSVHLVQKSPRPPPFLRPVETQGAGQDADTLLPALSGPSVGGQAQLVHLSLSL